MRYCNDFGDASDATVYNVEDHLGSSSIRLSTSGTVVDREEYYPFGDSSVRTFDKKRYRYTGKEKDAESGLYYYGARYYAAWTCRFISVDPLAHKFNYLTPYNYAGNRPIDSLDIDGLQGNNNGDDSNKNDKSGGGKEGDKKSGNGNSNIFYQTEWEDDGLDDAGNPQQTKKVWITKSTEEGDVIQMELWTKSLSTGNGVYKKVLGTYPRDNKETDAEAEGIDLTSEGNKNGVIEPPRTNKDVPVDDTKAVLKPGKEKIENKENPSDPGDYNTEKSGIRFGLKTAEDISEEVLSQDANLKKGDSKKRKIEKMKGSKQYDKFFKIVNDITKHLGLIMDVKDVIESIYELAKDLFNEAKVVWRKFAEGVVNLVNMTPGPVGWIVSGATFLGELTGQLDKFYDWVDKTFGVTLLAPRG